MSNNEVAAPPSRYERIVAMCQNLSLSYEEIAREFRTTPENIERIAAKAGVERPPYNPPLPESKVEAILALLEAGTPHPDIAARLGVSRQYVSRINLKYNPRRDTEYGASSEPGRQVNLWINSPDGRVSIHFQLGNTLYDKVKKWMFDNGMNSITDAIKKMIGDMTGVAWAEADRKGRLLEALDNWRRARRIPRRAVAVRTIIAEITMNLKVVETIEVRVDELAALNALFEAVAVELASGRRQLPLAIVSAFRAAAQLPSLEEGDGSVLRISVGGVR